VYLMKLIIMCLSSLLMREIDGPLMPNIVFDISSVVGHGHCGILCLKYAIESLP